MEINKNSIILVLSLVIVLLLVYILFNVQTIKTVTKIKHEPKVETVIEEKIIYIDKECKEKKVNKKEENQSIIEEEKVDIKEYVIASTTDSNNRFKVSLFSYLEPLKITDYKKVVLNGKLTNDESRSIFILDINLAILENIMDVYFKVTDAQTEEVYIAQDTCLYNLLENYIYKVNLEIVASEVICNVTEDRILEDDGKSILMKTKVKENMKDVFLKIDSNGIKP